PMPGATLLTSPAEVLGLRSQLGFDPEMGITPERFAAQLYAYPAEPSAEGTFLGGTYYFSPKS
ncbi:MAG: hypothetical protein M3328_12960, partial [Chloroflexota bacterium]|nr:hypothetical protein [Chloroflexota bacterium]